MVFIVLFIVLLTNAANFSFASLIDNFQRLLTLQLVLGDLNFYPHFPPVCQHLEEPQQLTAHLHSLNSVSFKTFRDLSGQGRLLCPCLTDKSLSPSGH